MEIVARKDARALGLKRYFTGAPCKRGHVEERLTANAACLLCHRDGMRLLMAARYDANPEPAKRNALAYYAENREHVLEQRQGNQAENTRWRQQWLLRNPGLNAAYVAARKAARGRATPRWLTPADHSAIKDVYAQAAVRAAQTGIRHEVDHIVPLRGKTVSGLHVPWNLQVIPMRENRSKGNKLAV